MASGDCCPLVFRDMWNEAFYFEDEDTDTDICQDDFRISTHCLTYRIQSKENKFLVLNDENQFEGKDLTVRLQSQPECKFNIQFFKCTNELRSDRPVMLYANKDNKKMVACCSDKHEINPVAMDLPAMIKEHAHRAMFYLKKHCGFSNMYTFESSLFPNNFLGFDSDGWNPSLQKLVLLKVDEVDQRCQMVLSS